MKIKPSILLILHLPLLLLVVSTQAKPVNTQPSFVRCPAQAPPLLDTGGRAVSIDSAQACINRYMALMAAHGFAAQAGLPINIRLKTTSLITTGESFNGKNFLDWLNAVANQYAASGKTLMINIQLGVYDMNYLNTYEPLAARRTANNNRIAIFVIPYDASTGQPVKGLAQIAGGTGGGGTGYDIGGIQP